MEAAVRQGRLHRPSAGRILDDWRKAPVKAADETTWPCNGVPGYVYGFFSKDCALYRRIAATRVKDGALRPSSTSSSNISVMETLSLRHKDPVGVLAEALKAYKPRFRRGMTAEERQMAKEAAAEKVADVLFPRDGRTKPKRE